MYKDSKFYIGEFKNHLQSLVVGTGWMGGSVTINGHDVETCHIEDIGNHLDDHLPSVQRLFGATLTQISECFKKHPWTPKDS